jgi:protein-S-isoprenylcysteine O-methyltransferase Ste14
MQLLLFSGVGALVGMVPFVAAERKLIPAVRVSTSLAALSSIRLHIVAHMRGKLYDLAAALPLMVWYAWGIWQDIARDPGIRGSAPATFLLVQSLAHLASMGFGALLVALLILRMPPVGKSSGLMPRLMAVAGTFAVVGFQFLRPVGLSAGLSMVAISLVLIGMALTMYALVFLGRSFSILPEARQLVTRGPYALMRHPVYAFEEIAVIGTAMQFAQPFSILLLSVHFALQLARMNYEERVLAQTYPEYGEYASRTARLIPGLY